jgi:zinc protease
VVGWMSDLEAMTPDDARAFFRKWYVPANAVVVVAGDVDVAKVRGLAEKYYGSIPAKATPVRKPQVEPEQKGLRRVALKLPAEQAFVTLGFKVPGISQLDKLGPQDKDALALLMLSEVLSGYSGARLERALEQGPQRVADSASSSASLLGRGPSMFMLTGIPAAGKTVAEVEAALRAEVQRVAREGVDASELARVKTQWIAGTVYERDSVFSQAQSLGSYWSMQLPVDAEERLLQHLKQITSAQVQDVAARYFGDDQLTIATLDPQPLDPGKPRRPESASEQPLH